MRFDKEKLDPIDLDQQAKYEEQGITRLSNNNSVVERDESGNVLLRENQNNPLLIIEPIYKKILNSSVVKILDTQFNYFNFPVRVTESPVDLDLDIDINIEEDIVSTNLTIPIPLDAKNQPINLQKINGAGPNTWYYDGDSDQGGFKQLQFSNGTQLTPNSYTITQEILDSLIEQNKTIRFKTQVQYKTFNNDETRIEYRMRLNRSNPKFPRPFKIIELVTDQNLKEDAESADNPHGFKAKTPANDYPFLTMTYVVDATDIQPGDTYNFTTVSSLAESFILAQNCFWDVELIDIPVTPGIYGASDDNTSNNAGVYQFSPNTLLRDSSLSVIARRSTTSPNQEIQVFS